MRKAFRMKGMVNKLKRTVLALCAALVTGVLPSFAIDAYVANLYREIDIAFLNKSEAELNHILSTNADSLNYYLLENYTMKKIRHLVIDEDYEFALQANLVVIDNDLNYTDAVEMYTIIAGALEKKKEQEQIREAKRQAELAKIEEEKAKKRAAADKEFNAVVTPEGKKVYIQDKKEVYTASYWNFRFGIADLNNIMETKNNYSSWRYGIALEGNYEYTFNKLLLGIDGNFEINFPAFFQEEGKTSKDLEEAWFEKWTPSEEFRNTHGHDDYMKTDDFLKAEADESLPMNMFLIPKLGFSSRNGSYYARAGFAWVGNWSGLDYHIMSGHLFSPAMGLGFDRLKLGFVTLGLNADFYITSMIKSISSSNAVAGVEMNMSVPISAMQKARLTFNMGVKDTIFVKDEGVENRARVILAIGAENVAK